MEPRMDVPVSSRLLGLGRGGRGCCVAAHDDDDDNRLHRGLVESAGVWSLATVGATMTGITIATFANLMQEQCALGPTIIFEAGTTHPYYITPNLCTIGAYLYLLFHNSHAFFAACAVRRHREGRPSSSALANVRHSPATAKSWA